MLIMSSFYKRSSFMNIELIQKLYTFHLHANLGFAFDGIENYEKYTIVYHNKIKDIYYNFITDIKTNTKEDFDKIMLEASSKMNAKNRATVLDILPFMKNIYQKRDLFLDDSYELVSNEVWQIYDDFDTLENLKTNCPFDVKLESTTNMKLYSEEMIKAYQTGNAEDPYGDLDSAYKDVYANCQKTDNQYTSEFFFAKINDKIVGITQGVYDNEIYGIYGLAVKNDFRCQGIGKEIVKQQLQMCQNKNLKLAFLQTENGFYPADMYRKLGFKDVCIHDYYAKRKL